MSVKHTLHGPTRFPFDSFCTPHFILLFYVARVAILLDVSLLNGLDYLPFIAVNSRWRTILVQILSPYIGE